MAAEEQPPRPQPRASPVASASVGSTGSAGPRGSPELPPSQSEKSMMDQLAQQESALQKLKQEIGDLKTHHVSTHAKAQQDEEAVTNKLLRKLADVRAEKERVLAEVRREEEELTNTIRKKLKALRRERGKLETMITNENQRNQELQGEVFKVTEKKHALQHHLSENSNQMLSTLHKFINELDVDDEKGNVGAQAERRPSTGATSGREVVSNLKGEIQTLRRQQEKQALRTKEQATRHHQMAQRIKHLDSENFTLRQKGDVTTRELRQLRRDKAQIESSWEQDDEMAFNRERRDRGQSVSSSCSEASTPDIACSSLSMPPSPAAREQAAFRALAMEGGMSSLSGNIPSGGSPAMHALTSPSNRRARSYSATSNPNSEVSSQSAGGYGSGTDDMVPPPHLSVAPDSNKPPVKQWPEPRKDSRGDPLPKLKPRQHSEPQQPPHLQLSSPGSSEKL